MSPSSSTPTRSGIAHLNIAPDGSTTVSTIDPRAEADAVPQAARSHDTAGAKAFVRFFWQEFHAAGASGDAYGLAAYTTADCDTCLDIQMAIADMAARGRRWGP